MRDKKLIHTDCKDMNKIGLLSDTHGYIDPQIKDFFKETDEIWHAGDIGSVEVFDELERFKPLKAVYGNIDGHDIRIRTKELLVFNIENIKVVMTHIGKQYGKYSRKLFPVLMKEKPQLVITGHSHILQVKYDKTYNFLFINPGAAGNNGIHKVKTACRFTINNKDIKDLEILELPR